MIAKDLQLSSIFHNPNIEIKYIYHGSPILINDRFMASETYFTIDKNIAKEYGKYIYSIELTDTIRNSINVDNLGEHFITKCLIPIKLFTVSEANNGN